VLGIGTGLGSCQLTRAPSKDPSALGDYHVNSLEAGMQRLPLYDDDDKRFDDYLKRSGKKVDRDDVQLLLSGSGLENLFEWYASEVFPVGCSPLYPNL